MITTLLAVSQAIAVSTFLLAGILCFVLGRTHTGLINIIFFFANLTIFYGARFLK